MYICNLLQIENHRKMRYIQNRRETSVETPGVKLSAIVIFEQTIFYTR